MKLVRFSTQGQSPRLGVLQGDRIADLQASLAATLTRRGVVRAQDIAAALVPASARQFLEGGVAAKDAVAGITEWVTVDRGGARLHAPIADPGKFICIGLNYKDHAEEAGQPIPKEPPIFAKWATSILDPGEPLNVNLYEWSEQQIRERGIGLLPQSLHEAMDALAADEVIKAGIGNDLAAEFIRLKRMEWIEYSRHVSEWETQRYLEMF